MRTMKPMARTTPAVHVFGWAVGLPLAFAVIPYLLTRVAGGTMEEANGAAVIGALVAILPGFALGLLSYFVWRGMRGWGEFFAVRNQRKAEDAEIEQAVEAYIRDEHSAASSPPPLLPFEDAASEPQTEQLPVVSDDTEVIAPAPLVPVAEDPWEGTNPYGCCMDNYDESGALSHGGPDCRHPQIVQERSATQE